eukprot:4773923-Pleurochrysis_carterae.AAC.2
MPTAYATSSRRVRVEQYSSAPTRDWSMVAVTGCRDAIGEERTHQVCDVVLLPQEDGIGVADN